MCSRIMFLVGVYRLRQKWLKISLEIPAEMFNNYGMGSLHAIYNQYNQCIGSNFVGIHFPQGNPHVARLIFFFYFERATPRLRVNFVSGR